MHDMIQMEAGLAGLLFYDYSCDTDFLPNMGHAVAVIHGACYCTLLENSSGKLSTEWKIRAR